MIFPGTIELSRRCNGCMEEPLHFCIPRASCYSDVEELAAKQILSSSPSTVVDFLLSSSCSEPATRDRAKEFLNKRLVLSFSSSSGDSELLLQTTDPARFDDDMTFETLVQRVFRFVPRDDGCSALSNSSAEIRASFFFSGDEIMKALLGGWMDSPFFPRQKAGGVGMMTLNDLDWVVDMMRESCCLYVQERLREAILESNYSPGLVDSVHPWILLSEGVDSASSGEIKLLGMVQFHRAHRLRNCSQHFYKELCSPWEFVFRAFVRDVLWHVDEEAAWEALLRHDACTVQKHFCGTVQREAVPLAPAIKELLLEIGQAYGQCHGGQQLRKIVNEWNVRRAKLWFAVGASNLSDDMLSTIWAMSGVEDSLLQQSRWRYSMEY